MKYDEFWNLLVTSDVLRAQAQRLHEQSERLQALALRMAGVEHVAREPGFACWTAKGVDGYFNTPQEAAKAVLK